VNAAILILAAAVFHKNGQTDVVELKDAQRLLALMLGSKWASILFAVALIAAGQSSTITGTLAGQIVMEGYLRLRISPALRRLITRLLAIIPATLVIFISGEQKAEQLLVFSQILLSMQLAFAVIPLIHFVSDKKRMGVFVITSKTKALSWLVALTIVALNLQLVYSQVMEWLKNSDNFWINVLIIAALAGLVLLLILTFAYPLTLHKMRHVADIHTTTAIAINQPEPNFKVIALALDYSPTDNEVLRYAMKIAQPDSKFVLMHIVESASSQMMEDDTEDFETRHDKTRLDAYLNLFTEKGYDTTYELGYKKRTQEIARICSEQNADLLIVGSHGHRGLKDFIFGETVNKVRHLVSIPVLVAK
jgi:manganese transport protein